jgi:hypothetical protein
MKRKLDIDRMPGRFTRRVFIGGDYDFMACIREIERYVREARYQPIVAIDFNPPKNNIHDYDIRLLCNCKYAIFEITSAAGQYMEIERVRDFRTVCMVYQKRSEHNSDIPSQISSMLTTYGLENYGYCTFKNLEKIVKQTFLKYKKNDIPR